MQSVMTAHTNEDEVLRMIEKSLFRILSGFRKREHFV